MPADVPSQVPWSRRYAVEGAFAHSAVAFCLAVISCDVSAQLSGSVALVSDYRYRGVTLSQNKPAAQLTVAYDDAQHWYAGAFVSTAGLAASANRELHAIPFVGYAWRTRSGVTWDVGVDYSTFTGPQSYDYPEVYGGVAFENISARVYYARRYLGESSDAIYGEVNGAHPIIDRVRLLVHAGVLHTNGRDPYRAWTGCCIFDARVGVGIDFDPFHIEVSWVGISAATAAYPITGVRSRNHAVLTLSRSF